MGRFHCRNKNLVLINSYYDGIASGYISSRATDVSRLTTDMKRASNYEGWDFENIWTIEEDASYPYLKNVKETEGVRTGLPTEDVTGGYGTEESPYIITTEDNLTT